MKKKITLALGMIMMICMLGACGTDPTTVDYNGYSYEDLKTDAQNYIGMVQSIAYIYTMNEYTYETIPADIVSQLSSQYSITDAEWEAADTWNSVAEEFGDFEDMDEETFAVTKSGNTLTTDFTLTFSKKSVDFQVVYDYYSMDVTGITVEPIYTLGEKMQKAGLNTVISISIVFCVLILISLLIACFNIFPYLEKKKAQQKNAAANAAVPASTFTSDQVVSQIVQREEQQQTDDTELIAVIAAAIAASTGTSTSDFVVRSINRR
jgi:hypothetical protein